MKCRDCGKSEFVPAVQMDRVCQECFALRVSVFDHVKLGRISAGEFQRYQELVGNRRGKATGYMLGLLKAKGVI